MRADAPPCVRCRNPWLGAVADAQLVARCQQEHVPIQNCWEDLPDQREQDLCDGMPGRPDHILALCCARMSAWDAPLHAGEMEWSPNRVFQINTDGTRIQTGWQGEWGCNICGRTLLQSDHLIGNALASGGVEAICPSDGQRTLVIDLAHGSTNWVCLPGCTHNFLVPDTPLPGCVDAASTTHHRSSLFSAMPPAANSEETNSFIYCPLLLQASGLLHPDAARGWCAAIPWFESLCQKLAGELYDVGHFAQAYAELLDISNRSNQAEAVAVADIRRLVAQYPPCSRLGVRCLVPAEVDANGHIPNLLQDLILQVYAGLPLASELDRAVSVFRELGRWPAELLQLNALSSAEPVSAGPCVDANHVDPPPAVPSDFNRRGRDAIDSNVFPTHLHQHACVQRRSAQRGTRRRCRLCNVQIPPQSIYYQCSQTCRFTACAECFAPSRTHHVPARERCSSAPPRMTDSNHTTDSVSGTSYGAIHALFDHVSCCICSKINGLISDGRFASLGVPQIRVEGTTSWGVWLRINSQQGAFSRRPRLLCGVLFHVANRTLTFHGDASSAAGGLLPIFRDGTTDDINDTCMCRSTIIVQPS